MRILFSMRHVGSFRLYESVLRRLAARGHDVHVMAHRRDAAGWGGSPEASLAGVPNIRWSWMDDVAPGAWLELATVIRIWLDYLRYFEPAYAAAPRLRARAAERMPGVVRRITGWPLVRTRPGRRALGAILRASERALPRQRELDDLIRHERPDAVLLTPLLHLGSPQVEVLRSARALGVKTALCVGSWDHLSSKSLIREFPDRVLVWNDTQKREAVDLHGVPAERVDVTGAQCYDQWFDRRPARSRDEFCRLVGLPADRPFLLWVCSALLVGSPREAPFVMRWIDELRRSDDPVLRHVPVLVRPHPARLDDWRDVDVSGLGEVAVYGSMPLDEHSREDYFESLAYSAAVVGLNTSAFLEAAAVGRPVYTILLPEFHENQEGTIHFHYLLREGGGLLNAARDFDTHRGQLAAALNEPDALGAEADRADAGRMDGGAVAIPRPHRHARFLEAFVRPHGLGRAATDVFADAVEALGGAPAPAPARTPPVARVLRPLLYPAALVARVAVARSAAATDRTVGELQRARQKERHRRAREADERRRKAAREAERHEKARQASAAREAEQLARQARVAQAARQKQDGRTARERQKAQHRRAKRRAAFVDLIKRRIGLHGQS